MFSFGYLPADGQQHKTVIEITGGLLGKEYGLVVKYFDRMRRSRNAFFYDYGSPPAISSFRDGRPQFLSVSLTHDDNKD